MIIEVLISDREMDRQTNISDSRVASVTKKVQFKKIVDWPILVTKTDDEIDVWC